VHGWFVYACSGVGEEKGVGHAADALRSRARSSERRPRKKKEARALTLAAGHADPDRGVCRPSLLSMLWVLGPGLRRGACSGVTAGTRGAGGWSQPRRKP